MLDTLLGSNLFGVIIGGCITLLSVYSVEFIRYIKESKSEKRKIYHLIVSELNMFRRFTLLAAQMDLLHDFHKCRVTIYLKNEEKEDVKYHKKEAQRRLLQYEEFQTKRIEIEGTLFGELTKYFSYVGKDRYLEGLISKIEDWEHPKFISKFETVNDIEQCMSAYTDCDKQIDLIDKELRKIKEDFLVRIRDKLKL